MLLEVEKLHAYYGKSHVLYDVSLGVDRGEVVVLLGRNGAGRSTTLKAIMGIVPPAGQVRFRSQVISGLAPFRIARMGMAYVPEERRIFEQLSVLENLKLAALRGRKGEWDVARISGLFPRIGERHKQLARGLSGGERQMLAIARALIANPDIILLDEPLEGLAPVVAQAIERAIAQIKAHGTTILLVEQNVRFALRVADRGYILNDGHVVAEGSAAQLRTEPELIARYLAVS